MDSVIGSSFANPQSAEFKRWAAQSAARGRGGRTRAAAVKLGQVSAAIAVRHAGGVWPIRRALAVLPDIRFKAKATLLPAGREETYITNLLSKALHSTRRAT